MTLKDVAVLSGCSSATVCKAFKNSPEVSEETKKRVIAAAEQCGYIKKATLHANVLGGIKTLIVSDNSQKLLNNFNNMKNLASKYDITLLYVAENEKKSISVMEQTGAIGLVVYHNNYSKAQDERIFYFSGDNKTLEAFIKERAEFKPKRPSRAKLKNNISAEPKAKTSAKPKTTEKEEIWLL